MRDAAVKTHQKGVYFGRIAHPPRNDLWCPGTARFFPWDLGLSVPFLAKSSPTGLSPHLQIFVEYSTGFQKNR